MNQLQIINIQGIECYEKDGIAYLNTEACARGLGFTQEKNGVEYVRWETVNAYLKEFGFPNKLGKGDFIPENIFYRLAMKAKNAAAEAFQAKIADEVIPSIRKTGAYILPNTSKEIQAIFMLDSRTMKHEERITALEENMIVDYGQQRTLAQQVNSVVIDALGGADSPAYHDKNVRGRIYSECNHDIQNWFRVNSRNNIPRKRFDEAVEYIQRWRPSTNMLMTIRQANGQTQLRVAGKWGKLE